LVWKANLAEHSFCPYFLSPFHWTLPDSPFNITLCQNVIIFHQINDLNMKLKYCFIIIDHQIDEKQLNSSKWAIIHREKNMDKILSIYFVSQVFQFDSAKFAYQSIFSQNVMSFRQTIDGITKFRTSLIISDPQIYGKTWNIHQKRGWKVNLAEYKWTRFCPYFLFSHLIGLCQIHLSTLFLVKIWFDTWHKW
jgi:hypothetical protein